MRIPVLSDLPAELKQPFNVESKDAGVIVLAGDSHLRNGIIRLAAELRDIDQVPVIHVTPLIFKGA